MPAKRTKPLKNIKRTSQHTDLKKFGHYSFIVGIVIAIIVGLIPQIRGTEAATILIILGVIVGFLNITAKETMEFLIAALVLMFASNTAAFVLSALHTALAAMWMNVVTFIAPAAIIVALKTVVMLAERR